MAAQPKKKSSKARGGKRAASKKYLIPRLTKCPKCAGSKIGHKICPNCGYYGQNLIFEPKEKTKVTRISEKEGK